MHRESAAGVRRQTEGRELIPVVPVGDDRSLDNQAKLTPGERAQGFGTQAWGNASARAPAPWRSAQETRRRRR